MNKQVLQDALEIVKPGLANKEIVPQSTSFAFLDGRVVTYNDMISVSHPVDFEITGAVEAEVLYKILGKFNEDSEIEITITENEILLFCGKAKCGMPLHNEITLPVTNFDENTEWTPIPEGLVQALKFAMHSCSDDASKPVLTCVHVDARNGVIHASDNYRITKYFIPAVDVPEFLIPASTVKQLVKYDIAQMAFSDGWAHFATDAGTVFSSRIVEDEFPDVEAFFDVTGAPVKIPESLSEILKRASVFAKDDVLSNEIVTVTMGGRKITIKAKSESGWFEEEANIRYSGTPVEFAVNQNLLLDILAASPDCTIGDSCLLFSGENWKHVIALLEV